MTTYPYPGLRPFSRDETEIFFGREEHTLTLLERLAQTRFLAVLGPSGYGKSSLARTGLLAALDGGMLPGAGSHWRIADLRPGDAPLARLAAALAGGDATLAQTLEKALGRGDFSLHEIYREYFAAEREGVNLLLLVDQFEELFRLCLPRKRAEVSAFIALLLAACQHPRIYVAITMRSDFLGDCAQFSGLPAAINRGLFLTPRLSRDQLREAIELPAQVFGGQVEPELANRLLNELGEQQDQLPVLAHALLAMWRLAERKKNPPLPPFEKGGDDETPPFEKGGAGGISLTTAHYDAIGGLQHALSKRLDALFAGLTAEQQAIAETLFRCLSSRAEGERDTRRPAPVAEIAAVAGREWREVAAVAEVFRAEGDNFLMPPPGVELAEDTVLDISHESLIRLWGRLQEWLEDEAGKAEMLRRTVDAARRWQSGRGDLWVGLDLAAGLAWREAKQPSAAWAARYLNP
jgi:hypothetical protein